MPSAVRGPRTLYDKVFQDHIVDEQDDGTVLLYIDRHLVHEVTSPQAFEGLRNAGRRVRRPDCTLATTDHNVPTTPRKNFKNVAQFIEEDDSRTQCVTLEDNVKAFNLTYFGLGDKRQGIVHIIGPEQGFTLPGTTVVCGDSHTSTHGAFGALAFGIGTSEVEHVLATQTLRTRRSKNMRVQVDGQLAPGVSSKDIILYVIGQIGTAGGTGAVIEFCGSAIRSLSMEARMSICNMSIEGGARAGMVAPDQTTFEYLKGKPLAPKVDSAEWKKAVAYWSSLKSDEDAKYDIEVFIDAKDIAPTVSWGTSPQDVVPITGKVPGPDDFEDENKKMACVRSLEYMGLTAGTPMEEIVLDKVFIGSCTNSRIEDLRIAANIVKGKKIASNLKRAMIVPGSGLVKKQAESEGLDKVFVDAGFEWREAGCSMCLGMNPDILSPKERCASTSNRNFEGRQGAGGRTHLMSPAMAAACALAGRLADVRKVDRFDSPPPKASARTELEPEVGDIDSDTDLDNILDIDETSQGNSVKSSAPSTSTGMPKFTQLKGIAVPLDRSNVDTDAIIPKQFLKTIKRSGLGSALFYAWRYNEDGSPNKDFVLNQEPYTKSKILVCTGPNFGCGSSREHAPWALLDFGITCIIAGSFGDIFFNNTFKNGMLPLKIDDKSALQRIADEAKAGKEIEVDLEAQTVKSADGIELAKFEVEEFRRHCLINGLDDIGLTMQMDDKIAKFERRRTEDTPWLDGSGYLKRGERSAPVKVEAAPVPKTNRGEEKAEPLEWPRITININAPDEPLDQELLTLDLPAGLSIRSLKDLVQAETNLTANSQHFYLNGQPISGDDKTVEEVGIGDGEMLAMLIRKPNAMQQRQQQQQQQQRRPQQNARAGNRRLVPGPEEIETTRLNLLGNPAALAQVREQKPELAAAVNDANQFRDRWNAMMQEDEERERERQNQIRLLNEDPFNVEAQRKIEEMIRQDRVVENLQHALEHNPE
ncbi:3-isopropylmalate dehydratase, partial [Elasticomyces elasticus]